MKYRNFHVSFLRALEQSLGQIRAEDVDRAAALLALCRRRKGRLFILGCGGGAGHASHAVNDFRKIAGIEAYCPSDNVSELTARINDEGWEGSLAGWLEVSRLGPRDVVMVFSVGGGDRRRGISTNLIRSVELAKRRQAKVIAVVGRDGGFVGRQADVFIHLPVEEPSWVTPVTEALQAVAWHWLVSHPKMQKHATKWESLTSSACRSRARR